MKCMVTVSKNVAGNELGFLNLEGFGPDVVTGNKYGWLHTSVLL
jgi:hypothetical protein